MYSSNSYVQKSKWLCLNKKPAELKAELDEFRKLFNLVYGQVIKSADDITNIATVMEQE